MPAPTPGTLIDRVDDTDRPIGLVRRDAVFATHAGFRVVHLLARNAVGSLLLQQVGAARDRSPLRWGSTVAGYVFADESYADAARRRAREEVGLTAPLLKLGNVRMPDHGATKFIELFMTDAETASIQDRQHVEALRFWTLDEIDGALVETPDLFTETFPYVFRLFLAATSPAT
jgi:isopentenyl-diphosphate delta-isomerase